MPKLKYKEGEDWKSIAPSQKEFDNLKDELVEHKLDYMPHRIQDLKNNKVYNFGLQVSAEGNPRIIFKEVI